mmetsp:Transcript_7517/g.9364  ORF Transcript_7517/g.9364 Transcript_7517/m.9364 type:complete len:167 (+) Transcript_7517:89-589(+)|eukprot:CAMPEP_0203683364 /NCGR_PEP_ID=MMETSP0090-20130426/47485_1 /ASSEMBLY_ACC=CAM_ASM_001088 /TAXON_ID=426623 /ORGANISM="Chaetoceros affinis, Strain CCMP159" /LENGTH=166 /DNA_ID=CAMNT_0050552507 /DNA_START=84 /DNA_END=584 /DNA_ORIENTATION=-
MTDQNNNNADNNFTVPLLDADNLGTNDNMASEDKSNNTTADNGSRALSTYSIVSIITLPFTLLVYILSNFQQYLQTSVEENEFIRPEEQKALEGDMDHVKKDQETISKDIDDLTRRVQALEERRRKREEAMTKFLEDRREEQNKIIAGMEGQGSQMPLQGYVNRQE